MGLSARIHQAQAQNTSFLTISCRNHSNKTFKIMFCFCVASVRLLYTDHGMEVSVQKPHRSRTEQPASGGAEQGLIALPACEIIEICTFCFRVAFVLLLCTVVNKSRTKAERSFSVRKELLRYVWSTGAEQSIFQHNLVLSC